MTEKVTTTAANNNNDEKDFRRADTDHTATSQSLPVPPHTIESSKVLETLHSDALKGLSETDAANRLELHGPNRLKPPRRPKIWNILLRQLANAMTVVLSKLIVLDRADRVQSLRWPSRLEHLTISVAVSLLL